MQNMPTATELAIKYAKREQLRIFMLIANMKLYQN